MALFALGSGVTIARAPLFLRLGVTGDMARDLPALGGVVYSGASTNLETSRADWNVLAS